ncbi:CASP8 and FADD-like apoptosis regulator isoform X2 [Xenopus laevis]|uniref:CASP8 and FADD-like apoptosis regulator isoform X2 n=1 Tax=Xenopus laevis TaxID=8355 RepID=A0A8J0U0X7_XENLA|nr:CASP8 and FADD-like apoptosis regulator isoform X2 [Xenopus laevis]
MTEFEADVIRATASPSNTVVSKMPACEIQYSPQLCQEILLVNEVRTMNIQQPVPSCILLQISDELDAAESEAILFLCRDNSSKTNVRDLLEDINDYSSPIPFGLAEVLYVIKRFDLLKKYLHTSKATVENLLKSRSSIPFSYRSLMVGISEQLEESDLESLIFLLKDHMRSGGKLKNKTFLTLVTELEKMNLIHPGKLDLLEQSFQNIRRIDLKNKIIKFKQQQTAPPPRYTNAFGVPRSNQRVLHVPVRPGKAIHFHKDSLPVQETGGFDQTEAERYVVRKETMGFCLIIDCVGNDASLLENTFKSLRFTVRTDRYCNVEHLESILKDVANMEQHKNHDIFVCIIISRGTSNSIFCIDSCSLGFSLDRIKHIFTGKSCPDLLGKPKLFFVQNYIAQEDEDLDKMIEADGPMSACAHSPKIPVEADIFWSHCKVAERYLHQSPSLPSLYFTYLSQLLNDVEKRKQMHLLDIHTELNRIICHRQEGCNIYQQHTLTKKLFFYPC